MSIISKTRHFKGKTLLSPIAILATLLWGVAHLTGIFYGTSSLPMHQSYVGDEQAPVNGALHILQDKSLIGLRNRRTVYYGPVFSVIAVPAVLADFGRRVVFDGARSAEDYKNHILWDWGGIVIWLRITTVLASLVGLYFIYKILMTRTCNPERSSKWALIGTSLIAFNYYYFQYSHFYKHWIFVLVILLAQIFLTIRLYETQGERLRHWISHGFLGVMSFGISYISIIFYVAFIPTATHLWRAGRKLQSRLIKYVLWVGAGSILMVSWHPYAFYRYLGLLGIGDVRNGIGDAQNPLVGLTSSWSYYLTEIFLNHAPLVFLLVIVLALMFHNKTLTTIGIRPWLWMFGSVAIVNLLLFAPAEHHEGRYMLPTILMLLLATSVILIKFATDTSSNPRLLKFILVPIFFYLGFHVVHIGKWIEIYAEGPIERQMLTQVPISNNDAERILFVVPYLVGWPHTIDSYQDYMERFNRSEVNLFKEFVKQGPPSEVNPLNAKYDEIKKFQLTADVVRNNKRIIMWFSPRPPEINQFDYMDESPIRLWYWDDLMPSYLHISQSTDSPGVRVEVLPKR